MTRPRIQIIPHLNYAELIRRYETCEDPKTKTYWLAIQLLSQPETPLTVEQVAETLGFSADWVRKLARRYNRLGPVGIVHSHPRSQRSQSRTTQN